MNKSMHFARNIFFYALPVLIVASSIFLAKSKLYDGNQKALSIGIIVDLLITAPLVYFLVIRKTVIPKLTVVPFFFAGIIIASLVIPLRDQWLLDLAKTWIIPVIELTLISILILKIRKALRNYRRIKLGSTDFFDALKEAGKTMLPEKLVPFFVTEIAVFYYAFFVWRQRKLRPNEFSYHKSTGTIALLFAVIGIVCIETFALHLLLSKWSSVAAWVLTIISAYTALQIFGFIKSIWQRPVVVTQDGIKLRYGILSETTISFDSIASIELSTKMIHDEVKTKKLSPFGDFESHTILLHLKQDNVLERLYGFKKTYTKLAFSIDEKEKFYHLVKSGLEKVQ